MNDSYQKAINKESTVREISKQELFNESKSRIKMNQNLPEFCGYDSKLDIYGCQSEFTKI